MITLTATKIGTMFYYIVSTFADGAHRIASSLPKKMLYLVLVLLAPTFQLLSVSKSLLFSLLPYFIIIDIALALMLVFLFSDWKRISTLYSFSTINFCNSTGAYPWLVCRSSSGGVITYTFQCRGISLNDWRERQKDLESAFDCHILSINYADGSDNLLEVKFVPAKGALPTNVPAPNFSLEDFVIKLGISFAGEYCINFNRLVHMLITGATGGGKTILVRWIIYQLVNKFATVFLISTLPCLADGNMCVCLGCTLYRDDGFFQFVIKILCVQRPENFLKVSCGSACFDSLFHFRVPHFRFSNSAFVIPSG